MTGAARSARLDPVFHLVIVLTLFFRPLFRGTVLFYRDISVTYYPDYVFVAEWLRRGVWPLWHPGVDAGVRFLMVYPIDLVLLALGGARFALAVSPTLHLWWGMWGMSRLARRLGIEGPGAWLAGAGFGLSGLMISSLLYPNFLAAAWTPWAVLVFLGVVQSPAARQAVALAGCLALQLSAFGAEVVVQTALIAVFLCPRRPSGRALGFLALALGLSLALAAPALLGVAEMLKGSQRAQGFPHASAFAYSADRLVLLETIVPRLFGDPHAFSDTGWLGAEVFQEGSPYYLSLYLGPILLLLGLQTQTAAFRLVALAAIGALLSLGPHGPLAPVLSPLMVILRGPIKFFFTFTVALCLLAGSGLERLRRRQRRWGGMVLMGVGLAAVATAWTVDRWPQAAMAHASRAFPRGLSPDLQRIAVAIWPREWAATGALTFGAGLAVTSGATLTPLAALLALLDMARITAGLNPTVDPAFYHLRSDVRAAVDECRGKGSGRFFSYGIANSPPLHWSAEVHQRQSDLWLFYLDRQALLPRTQVLDALEGTFDLDRMGWAPPGSTLSEAERSPLRFRDHYERLRESATRFVVAFHALPEDLVRLCRQVPFREVSEPLRIYELRDPLPRAFWIARLPGEADRLEPSAGAAPVEYQRIDPHTVRLHARTPPGFLAVLDGYDPAWMVEGPSGPVPLLRLRPRYWAIPTPGGEARYEVRFRPRWRVVGFGASALAAAAGLVLAIRGGAS